MLLEPELVGAGKMGCIIDVRTIHIFLSNSSKDFLSEIDPSIIQPKNVIGLE